MELDALTQHVHDQLTASAALGDERTREIAAALAATARSSVRLAILEALSAASAEITDALYAAGNGQATPAVTVHLEGADTVRFTVSGPPGEPAEAGERRPVGGRRGDRPDFTAVVRQPQGRHREGGRPGRDLGEQLARPSRVQRAARRCERLDRHRPPVRPWRSAHHRLDHRLRSGRAMAPAPLLFRLHLLCPTVLTNPREYR